MNINITEVIQEHGTYLYRFAVKLSGHPDIADEIVQETFIKANDKQDQLKDIMAIRGWLRTICLNEFRMKMRTQKKEDELSRCAVLEQDGKYFTCYDEDIVLNIVVSDEIEKMRNGCFLAMSRKLTLPQRMAFSLCDMFGLSTHEVAGILQCSEGALKGLLYRARLNLESFFADHCVFMKEGNACHCSSWLDFVQKRASIQKNMITSFHEVEYTQRKYASQKEIRDKLLYYYHHMQITAPDDDWYENIIRVVQSK